MLSRDWIVRGWLHKFIGFTINMKHTFTQLCIQKALRSREYSQTFGLLCIRPKWNTIVRILCIRCGLIKQWLAPDILFSSFLHVYKWTFLNANNNILVILVGKMTFENLSFCCWDSEARNNASGIIRRFSPSVQLAVKSSVVRKIKRQVVVVIAYQWCLDRKQFIPLVVCYSFGKAADRFTAKRLTKGNWHNTMESSTSKMKVNRCIRILFGRTCIMRSIATTIVVKNIHFDFMY